MSESITKQDIAVSDIRVRDGKRLRLDLGTIAAAGTDQTNATAIVDQVTYVTASDGTKGVILPSDAQIGEIFIIHNSVNAQNCKLWPPTLGTLNGGTATTGSVLIAGEETCIMIKATATAWYGGVLVDF